jgi:hypothetical protein
LAAKQEDPDDPSVAELVRAIARYRVDKAEGGLIALAAGGILLVAALVVLLVMLTIWLAAFVGPIGAGLIVATPSALGGLLLVRSGYARAKVLLGDDEDRQALRSGERKA